jgi:hypothetical protein
MADRHGLCTVAPRGWSAGYAYRLPGHALRDEFHRNESVRLLLLRYTQALITQMAQTVVCNRHHSVDQQLCRWLLPYLRA